MIYRMSDEANAWLALDCGSSLGSRVDLIVRRERTIATTLFSRCGNAIASDRNGESDHEASVIFVTLGGEEEIGRKTNSRNIDS